MYVYMYNSQRSQLVFDAPIAGAILPSWWALCRHTLSHTHLNIHIYMYIYIYVYTWFNLVVRLCNTSNTFPHKSTRIHAHTTNTIEHTQ